MEGANSAEPQMTEERVPTAIEAAPVSNEEWQVISATVRGASHQRADTPNQDSILVVRESSTGLPIILSLSDGHGSDKCFRSHRGSRFAVQIGAELMREVLQSDPMKGEEEMKSELPLAFARRWNAMVAADLERQPLSKEELDRLEAKDNIHARQAVEAYPPLAYGATSLTVALTQSFILFLQLGDGEILTVSETGEITKPVAEDERLLANETTSLCAKNAAADFRISFQFITNVLPALILLSTDGYANSFRDDAGFQKVGSDVLEMLRADGFDAVNRSVQGWLEEATRMGSGDDCTLGIICRMSALKPCSIAEPIHAETKTPQSPSKIPSENIGGADVQQKTEEKK
jgi:serine/threonine protein phosphatase PrpC